MPNRRLLSPIVRSALRVIVTVALVLLLAVIVVVNPSVQPLNSETPQADAHRLRADVVALCGTTEPRSVTRPDGLAQAGAYVNGTLQKLGLPVRVQEFEVEGKAYRNYSVLFGDEKAARVVVGAHYDVFGHLPGADDNASGVAAVLELARLLAARKPTLSHAIELVLWSNEEPPYFGTQGMGSVAHARRLSEEKIPVKLAVSVEMIGYFSDEPGSQKFPLRVMGLAYPTRGNFLAIVGKLGVRPWWIVRRAKAAASLWSSIPLRSINAPAFIPGIDFSDHRSYWSEGFPAIMITDTSFYRNDRYHTDRDVPDTLDYRRMAESVNAIYGIATEM